MSKDFKKTNHPDDLFFRQVMSKPTSAKAYLEHFSPEISKTLDLETLIHVNESFIDEQLDLFQSDIIYRCQLKGSQEKIYISFIWEHKSNPETYVSIQIGLYILLAMYKMSKEKGRKLEVIIPFLFYNGAQNWKPKTIHDLYSDIPNIEFFKPFIPQYQLIFKNIVKSEEDELLAIKDAFFRSAMFAMASKNDVQLILKRISRIFGISEDSDILVILNYIHHFSITSVMLKKALLETDNPIKNKVMTTMESLALIYKNEGIEEGIEKGIEKGIIQTIINMYKKGFDIQMIIEVSGMDFEFVNKTIQEHIEKENLEK